MPPEPISALSGRHRGETIYVVASGSPLDESDPADYADEVTVTMNRVPLFWPLRPTYAMTKYHSDARELMDLGLPTVVVSRGDRGHDPAGDLLEGAAYYWDHLPMPDGWDFDLDALWPTGENHLINAQTVQMSALHFAAHLGASRIVLLGTGGRSHVAGYYPDPDDQRVQAGWLDGVLPLIRRVAERVEEVYGCRIENLAD